MLPCNAANPVILTDDRSEKVLYDYPDYPIYIRRGLLSFYPEYKASSHWHDDVEFISVFRTTDRNVISSAFCFTPCSCLPPSLLRLIS